MPMCSEAMTNYRVLVDGPSHLLRLVLFSLHLFRFADAGTVFVRIIAYNRPLGQSSLFTTFLQPSMQIEKRLFSCVMLYS